MDRCHFNDLLSAWLDDQLSEEAAHLLTEHLPTCEACRQGLDVLTSGGLAPKPSWRNIVLDAVFLKVLRDNPPPPVRVQPPAFTRYADLEEIALGGMGVVYRATDLTLKREVALKMIHKAKTAANRDQFQREAEAVARLAHPHIVQIFEVSECEGQPYLALEFVSGGSLSELLQGKPQPPLFSARLLEILARAIQHAHDQGIVHRDLKPANILLQSMETSASSFLPPGFLAKDNIAYYPKITDFGLATALRVDVDASEANKIAGTPSYMAPEQLGEYGMKIGRATDVYALGAILYETITGRPPFHGVTVRDTLDQVRKGDPVPLTRIQSKCPRDLETICLKCLQKNPENRYDSAAALAEDLARFLAGEPIRARPVGRTEQFIKAVKRRPAISALVALAIVLLIGGSALSTYFGVDAVRQADQSKKNEIRAKRGEEKAKKNEEVAVAAQKDLEKANADLVDSRDELERTLVRGLLRSFESASQFPYQLRFGHRQTEALWQLAQARERRIGYRFIEEALKDPLTTRQLRVNADAALHAAILLDLSKRQQVENLLLSRLKDSTGSEDQLGDIAFIVASLGDVSPDTAAFAADALIKKMANTENVYAVREQAKTLEILLDRLQGKVKEETASRASTILVQKIANNGDDAQRLSRSLASLVVAAKASEAQAICEKAADAIANIHLQETQWLDMREMCSALEAYFPFLGQEKISHVASKIVQAIEKNKHAPARLALAQCSAALAKRDRAPDPPTWTPVARILTQAMVDEKLPYDRRVDSVKALLSIAQFLEKREASSIADTLVEAITNSVDPVLFSSPLAEALKAVVDQQEPRDRVVLSKRVGKELRESIENQLINSNALARTRTATRAQAVGAAAVHMPSDEAALVGATLVQVIRQSEPVDLRDLVDALLVVLTRLDKKQAATISGQVVDTLVQSLLKSGNPFYGAPAGIVGMSPYLHEKDAAHTAQTLAREMAKTDEPFRLGTLGSALPGLTRHIESSDVESAATRVMQAMAKMNNDKVSGNDMIFANLSSCLAILAPRMGKKQLGDAALLFPQAIRKASNPISLADNLATLAEHMDPNDGAETVSRVMAHIKAGNAMKPLSRALSVTERGLSPEDTDRVRAAVVAMVLQRMSAESLDDWPEGALCFEFLVAYDNRLDRYVTMVSSAAGTSSPLTTVTAIAGAMERAPSRLSEKELAEVLKMPSCFGNHRALVLHELESHYRRKFSSQWAFVRFAEQRNLGFDFTTPPRRATPATSKSENKTAAR